MVDVGAVTGIGSMVIAFVVGGVTFNNWQRQRKNELLAAKDKATKADAEVVSIQTSSSTMTFTMMQELLNIERETTRELRAEKKDMEKRIRILEVDKHKLEFQFRDLKEDLHKEREEYAEERGLLEQRLREVIASYEERLRGVMRRTEALEGKAHGENADPGAQ